MFEMFEHFFTIFGFISFWGIISLWIIAATRKVTSKPWPEKDDTVVLSLDEYRALKPEPFDQAKH